MAQRRMFSLKVVDTDMFLDMSPTAQNLYFHLAMRADDDGFVSNPKKIAKMVSPADDDLKMLTAKEFIIPFQSGVIVIRHWKENNYIQSDRKHDTIYQEEKKLLREENGGIYRLNDSCIQNGYKMDTEVRLGKVRLGEVKNDFSKEKSSLKSDKVEEEITVTNVDEDGYEKINRFGKKEGEPKTAKNTENLALVHKFYDMVEKETGVKPMESITADYIAVCNAIKKGGFTPKQIVDIYDWWFGRRDVNVKILGSLTACLSPKNLTYYKMDN